MEIKTCEEYVLNRLAEMENKNAELEKLNDELWCEKEEALSEAKKAHKMIKDLLQMFEIKVKWADWNKTYYIDAQSVYNWDVRDIEGYETVEDVIKAFNIPGMTPDEPEEEN